MSETSSFDDKLSNFLFQTSTISSTWGILVFYILQLRSLKKFFQSQKLEKSEIRMNKVLNSQSDSIVVVSMTPAKAAESGV